MATSTSVAPGRLGTVRAFVNTWDIDLGRDVLATTSDLETWLTDARLLDDGAKALPVDVRRAIALREALRAALEANHSECQVPADALAVLNNAAARASLSLSLTSDSGWVARPRAPGIDGALGEIVVIVAEAMTKGTWRRLKVCANDTCRWAFYDNSRARSGKWCSMKVCGNTAKQNAWRARRDNRETIGSDA